MIEDGLEDGGKAQEGTFLVDNGSLSPSTSGTDGRLRSYTVKNEVTSSTRPMQIPRPWWCAGMVVSAVGALLILNAAQER